MADIPDPSAINVTVSDLAEIQDRYDTADEVFTRAFGSDLIYRAARDICIYHFCNGVVSQGDGSSDELFQILYSRDRALSTAVKI